MTLSRRSFLRLGGLSAAGLAFAATDASAWGAPAALAGGRVRAALPLGQGFVDESGLIHLLNRLTYGARPEDVARVAEMGIEAYIDSQLNPESIDDSALDERMRLDVILNMSRDEAYRLEAKEYRAWRALAEGFVERAVYSQRQLFERMAEFWTDHFNIGSDELPPELVVLHREVIRRHALGNFRDLLFGTARSPAMLYYLDNYLSDAEHPNENYARELLELHTLGVDGGHYTEQDVKEVARALTGWTIHQGTVDGFVFNPEMHDTEEKFILGHAFPAGRGIEDGLHVLSIVANHPATAYFLCTKLCRRFVSDQPPASLVDSAAQVWMQTEGDIRSVLRHIFFSQEFWASSGQKLRRPLDFLTAAMRATGAEYRYFWVMEESFRDLAQPPYGWHPPDGYPDVAGAWMNTGGLLARWNIAMQLTYGATGDSESGVTARLIERIDHPQTVGELVDAVAMQVYAAPLAEGERATFISYTSDGAGADAAVDTHLISRKLPTLFGLMIASPGFQWR
jgi:uncharacterized protein (DUF1800 family)